MKWGVYKKIFLSLLVVVFVANVFITNIQTFDTSAEQCSVQNLHSYPCALVHLDGGFIELEQVSNIYVTSLDVTSFDNIFISLVQEKITPPKTVFITWYARDHILPGITQLPRSHIMIS